MHIVISIPAIEGFPKGVPHFWLNRMFIGSVTGDPQVNALSTTFVRLVESALIDYRQAREAVFEFWADSGFPLGIMHLAISRYEACVSDMSRAVRCFRRLRRHESLPEELRMALNVVRPRFVADQIYERLAIYETRCSIWRITLSTGRSNRHRPSPYGQTAQKNHIQRIPGKRSRLWTDCALEGKNF